jgi:hypothetical protein
MESSEPVRQSLLLWCYQSLGFTYSVLFLLSLVGCFFLTLLLLGRGKGAMAATHLLLVVHWPLMVGILGAIQGTISMYQVIAFSSETAKPTDYAAGISVALFSILVGILITLFLYMVTMLGLLMRSFSSESTTKV